LWTPASVSVKVIAKKAILSLLHLRLVSFLA
jgi:hypothetical protein